jgi:hypothetical protein
VGIPGRTLDRLDIRGKVKIGEKRKSAKGRDYPAATDYFLSDDPDFFRIYGGIKEPRVLAITLPYATADENFSTGLERWLSKKDRSGQVLTCYTKDSGSDPIALRLTDFVQEADTVRGPERGQHRTPISCGADNCVFFKDKTCKPMGRLTFFLEGDNHAQPLQLDTKAWNSIERIAGSLKSSERLGPLNKPGRVFELTVAFHKKGTDRFPVVSIQEANVVITPDNIDHADALMAARGELERGTDHRVVLAHLLDVIRPGWREQQSYIDRIKEVGAEAALAATFQRYEA